MEGSFVSPGSSSIAKSPTVSVVTPQTTGYSRLAGLLFKKSQSTFNIKVVQASIKWLSNGKPEFHHIGQLFVDITEATANVNYILSVVQRKWGEDHTIVTADGLQLEDCCGTQGVEEHL